MRLKVLPEDFRVKEVLTFKSSPSGPYFVHRLRKEKLDTLEAIGIVAKEGGITREDIAFAGLKDRQAETEQWISIRGKRLDIDRRDLQLQFVSRSEEPVTSKLSAGNAFQIVVRDLTLIDLARIRRNTPSLLKAGFPNYFDDQRFGCLKHGQGFAMKSVLAGDFEQALHQIVARPSRVAISGDVKLKKLLARHWRDWEACARIARGPLYQKVFKHLLDQPDDFRGALALLPTRMKLIHAFAYQSFLWNRAVAKYVRRNTLPRERVELETALGGLVAWRYLKEDQLVRVRASETPLYGPEGTGGAPPFAAVMREVLEESQLTPRDFLENKIPGMVLKEEQRPLLVEPREFSISEAEPDETSPGRSKVRIAFELPRGAYATMLIKRLFADPPQPRTDRMREPERPRRPRHGRKRPWQKRPSE